MNKHRCAALAGLIAALAFGSDAVAVDSDNDTIDDATDNCTLDANKGQDDADADHYGNACDADFNNDLIVGIPDFLILGQCLSLPGQGARESCRHADLNSDNRVNGADNDIFEDLYGEPPGPSCCAP